MKLLLLSLFISSTAFAGLKVVPGTIKGFEKYPDQLDRIQRSFGVIEAVINSEEFKQKVIAYKGKSGKGYTNNKGLTNEGVYEFLMSGKEVLGGNETLGEINFDIKRHYFGWFYRKKVKAETNTGVDNVIKVSEWFYWDFGVHEMAGNLTHEWIHLMGFSHSSAKDHDSVPYAVGYIMRDMAAKYLEQGFVE